MVNVANKTDEALFKLLKGGSHGAFTEIYRRYWHVLYLYCCKMLHDEERSKDLIQDIFTGLWQQAAALDIHTSLKSYLYGAVRNQTARAISQSKLREEYAAALVRVSAVGAPVTEDELRYREFERMIEKSIAGLPPRMRLMFEKSRKEGLSHKAIAQELQVSENTVKTTIFRAMTILRSHISLWLGAVLSFLLIRF